jgi:Fe-S cluster assembly protein SufD
MSSIMTEVADKQTSVIDRYLTAFDAIEKSSAGREPGWALPLRKAGMARFAELGFPTTKEEDWRFTNVAPIARLPFLPAGGAAVEAAELEAFPFSKLAGSRLVFVDGVFSSELSTMEQYSGGVIVSSLATAMNESPDLLEKHLGRYAGDESAPFAAMNMALFTDGVFIHAPNGAVVENPVQALFVSTAGEEGATTNVRNLIVAAENSGLTLVESHVALKDGGYFTNVVNEFSVGENARVEHVKFQNESKEAFHIGALHAKLERASNFTSHSIAVGARISRNNLRTNLAGEGLVATLNGLYLTAGEQLADHHMVVDHARPNCESHEYFNGILADKSKGVFHGRIHVHQEAQKTDAKQTNKNLLLSDDATVDTKPQLEIYADDVKCTHGATIGQMCDDAIFYLRARGIGYEKARQMLMHAFAGEIIDRVVCEPVREELDAIVWDCLETDLHLKDAED